MRQRCVGLPVVVGHPEDGVLDTKEFVQRVIGIVVHTFNSRRRAELAVGRHARARS